MSQPPTSSDGGAGEGREPDATELTGTILAGRYRVIRRLGVGAMGAVYLGEHTRIGRRDAIKVLRAAMARDPEAIARFTRGARNVSRIRHPNVCTLYDFGNTEEGFHFLAMEYVDGPTLGQLLEDQGPLSPERAVALISQVGEALQAAHSLGIIHRDLKPDNIMVARQPDGSEQVKVVDFDIARGPAEEEGPAVTRHGFVVGTPEYMSPEQLTGDPLDGRSDIYSMALVLFRMLTGKLPFEGETAQEIMVQRLTREPTGLSEVAGHPFPRALERTVAAGLARKAGDRPADARSFARQLQEAVREGGITPAAPSPASEAGGVAAAAPLPTRAPGSGDPESPLVSATGEGEAVSAGGPASGGGVPSAQGTSAGERGGGGSPRLILLGIGLVALLIIGGGGVAAYLALGALGGGEEDEPEVITALESEFDAEEPAPPQEEVGSEADPDSPAAEEGQPSDPPAEEELPPQRDPDPPEETRPSPIEEPEAPVREAGIQVDPEEATATLRRLFIAMDEAPTTTTFEAIRDTVSAIREAPGLPVEDRAFAAYVLGLTLIPLGDSIRGVELLEEAARLDPIERYISVRDVHRGGL
jgi:eukaryotic-like serine/threonine-protein kinase